MEIVFYFFTVIATFFFMEFMAWFTHKYIMHGIMWYFHKDHHQHEPGFFEKNDVFFLIFAIPSWLCIMLGLMNANYYVVSIGIGIAIYGLFYFLMHDIFIHQRFKLFRNSNNTYLLALRKAHKIHHKHLGKEHGEVFGMLIVPSKYFKESKVISKKSGRPYKSSILNYGYLEIYFIYKLFGLISIICQTVRCQEALLLHCSVFLHC